MIFMLAPSPNEHFFCNYMRKYALVYARFGAGTHPPLEERIKILRGMDMGQ